ncbi:MAG TPA: amino acid racemase [Chloroflexota bacterium]|nr:amino acid racemase [Chloroflexota bacterium]
MRRTIGVIGGMGPAATVDFFRRIVDSTAAATDQDHLHVIVDNQPAVPDRTAFIRGEGPDPTETLIAAAHRLESAGADLLVMACNTAHVCAPAIADAVSTDFVNWIEVAARGVRERLPEARSVALFATEGTIAAGLYQQVFAALGIQVILPDAAGQAAINAAIYGPEGVKAGPPSLDPARWLVDAVGQRLAAAGADCALLACTELSALYDRPADWGIPVFDAAQLVAEHVIELAGARVKGLQDAAV